MGQTRQHTQMQLLIPQFLIVAEQLSIDVIELFFTNINHCQVIYIQFLSIHIDQW